MFDSVIRKRVMDSINHKIDLAEKKYADQCKDIDVEAQEKKELLLDETVNSIVGKIF